MPEPRSANEPTELGGYVLRRVCRAPREFVFEAWTKAEHFSRWFGPDGFQMPSCEIDARPGGVIRFTHRAADGMTLHLKGTFRDVVPNTRLELTLGFVDERGRPVRHPMFAEWPLEAMIEMIVLLEDVAEGTRVTIRQYTSPARVAAHEAVKENQRLAVEVWKQVLAHLDEHLSLAAAREEHPT